jgi:hypothetical protein
MRRLVLCLSLVLLAFAPLYASPPASNAAGCVRFVDSQFNPPGNDNDNLDAEWVRIKNFCATRKNIGGWRVHDYHRDHTYTFASTVRIRPFRLMTLYTGSGTDTGPKKYWGRASAVWNNEPPERAHLRTAEDTLRSTWTES